MKRMYPWVIIFLILAMCGFAYFNQTAAEGLQKIDIYKANGFYKAGHIPIATIHDKNTLNSISTILKKSKKMPGILDVASPEFILEVHDNKGMKVVYLWLGKKDMQGMYMFKTSTETGYSISMSNTVKFRKIMGPIKDSTMSVKRYDGLTLLHIVLPKGWHLDTKDKWQYNFVNDKGKNNGWIIAEKYEEDGFSNWKPNHSTIIEDESIDTPLGKGRVFTLDADNGTAASGITGTHNVYYAIIPVKNNIRFVLEFSRNDKKPETKDQFIKILKNLSVKS